MKTADRGPPNYWRVSNPSVEVPGNGTDTEDQGQPWTLFPQTIITSLMDLTKAHEGHEKPLSGPRKTFLVAWYPQNLTGP